MTADMDLDVTALAEDATELGDEDAQSIVRRAIEGRGARRRDDDRNVRVVLFDRRDLSAREDDAPAPDVVGFAKDDDGVRERDEPSRSPNELSSTEPCAIETALSPRGVPSAWRKALR